MYSRRDKRPRHGVQSSSFFDAVAARAQPKAVKIEEVDEEEFERLLEKKKKKRKFGSSELVKLGVDSNVLRTLDGPRLRECRSNQKLEASRNREKLSMKKRNSSVNGDKFLKVAPSVKKWVG